MTPLTIAQNALEAILRVGRGTSGRLILDLSDEQMVREALAATKAAQMDMQAAFEAKYQRDWNDPASNEMKAVWADAWTAAFGAKKLLVDAEYAIRSLREYIAAIPDETVAAFPAMPGIDGDWLDRVQSELKTEDEDFGYVATMADFRCTTD